MSDSTLEASASCLANLRSVYQSLHPAERNVADVILHHPSLVVTMAVSDLAIQAHVAESSVVRFCKSLGYRGYQELKAELARDLATPVAQIHEEITQGDDPLTIARKILIADRDALQDTLLDLDGVAIANAVGAIAATERVDFYGVGSSAPLAVDAFYRFLRIGVPAGAHTDSHMMAVAASTLRPGMVAVGISHTGSTTETLQALTYARQAGATTICLTSFALSPITQVADIRLITACTETAFRSEAMASRIAQLSMVDALYAAVAIRRIDTATPALARSNQVISQKRL